MATKTKTKPVETPPVDKWTALTESELHFRECQIALKKAEIATLEYQRDALDDESIVYDRRKLLNLTARQSVAERLVESAWDNYKWWLRQYGSELIGK